MITEISSATEIGETAAMTHSVEVGDKIKRNHPQPQKIEQLARELVITDFTVKFARLKKALRKRSTTIL